MKIIDPRMLVKMERALKLGLDLYNLDDIDKALKTGDMQSHTVGDTVAITRINCWPQRKAVDVVFVVGNIDEAMQLEREIEDWGKDIGADLMTAIGREGWWRLRTPGWRKVGTMYAKEIKS